MNEEKKIIMILPFSKVISVRHVLRWYIEIIFRGKMSVKIDQVYLF